ncbi:nitroreductase family protein [Streptomyces sp. N2-109]|uniref:Nitroreductase family protein n=1 Tax=Streptomyces gossypii TaxID=2883101 RepID=A0ABT2JPC8_9ACTN|nr:nitroreductase family protein [Streptomyces gossypii]MCT2589681.1 nitroreductase family protein [Streptomyces gossypii]
MGYAHEYATAIMHRGRVPMEPSDFVPNWSDGPRKGKFYPGVTSMPLPASEYPAKAHLDEGLRGGASGGTFDLEALSGMLLDSYGLTGRRLGVQANTDLPALPFYPLANWSRGSASGGGLYPVGVYWVSGPSGPVPPGLHYYSARHHAMQRLLTGDVTGQVRDALTGGDAGAGADGPSGAAADADQYLVLSVKYWQNAFKYNSFSFHAVSMDVGACLQTWRMWARARGLEVEPAMWFDEERLARLLGVRAEEEGVFAVVPLRWTGTAPATAPPAPAVSAAPASVRHRDSERSRTVLTFDSLVAMQTATVGLAAERPAAGVLVPAAAPPADPDSDRQELPPARQLDIDVRTALRRRRSSFGRFEAQRPIEADELAACLAAADAGALLGGDTTGPPGDPAAGESPLRLTKFYAFVNHVRGVPPGAYAYDPADSEGPALRLVRGGPCGNFLQRNYFLSNYNLEQAAAVLVPTIRTHAVLDAVGDRGYRLVNATIGAVAQTVYTASAALGLGCGVALGFDNISYIEELGIGETGESPLLIMMIGHERGQQADFRYEIA